MEVDLPTEPILTGGCACGAVRYELTGVPTDVSDCHCRLCQRAVGAAVVTWASVDTPRLQIVRGEPRWWRSSASAERGFCPRCGASLLFRQVGGGPSVDLTVATLDEPGAVRPSAAIWLTSRQPWVHLAPAVAQHADGGDDWTPSPPAPHPSGELSYREDHEVDVLQLAALFTAVGFSRSTDPGTLRAVIDGARWVVSAWSGGELVGFARAISDGVSNGYVSAVAVKPGWQRRGIGTELIRRLVAGRTGVKFVLRTSEAGEGLYRSFGFVDADRMMVRPRSA